MKGISAATVIGIVSAVPAAFVIAGWLLREPAVIRLVPGAVMVFNTALCFALAAVALASEPLAPAWRRTAQTGLGAAVALLAGLVLSQYAFGYDLGIDWPEFHRWFIDDNPYPGRMSPPTAFAFLVCGATLVLMHRVRGLRTGFLAQALTGLVIAAGLIGVIGYLLKLPLIYRNYLFGQMALPTAVGFIVVGSGLWLAWRRDQWYQARRLLEREEQRISLYGAIILGSIVFVAELASLIVMQRRVDALVRENLRQVLDARVALFRINIDLRASRAEIIATRPSIGERVARLNAGPDDHALASLRLDAESYLPLGFAGLALGDPEGRPWVRAGRFADKPALEVKLARREHISLLWDDGYVLRSRIPVLHKGETAGVMLAEQRLSDLGPALHLGDENSASGETAVCTRDEQRIACFPQRLVPHVFSVPHSNALPMAHALAGETGVLTGRDYRGENVVAALGPIGALGLGMVTKIDTVEVYAPLREGLHWSIFLLVLIVGAGILLLHRSVAPLARSLALNKERLKLALEGTRAALWDWNLRTNLVHLDELWEEMLGRASRATAVSIQELERIAHPEDAVAVRAHLREVLDGGAPRYDVEHRVRAESGEWIWIRSRGKVVQRGSDGRALRLIGTNVDINLRKQAELGLYHRANHDALTGLPNRTLFHDRMARAMLRAQRGKSLMAVMYLDVDKFKSINDTLGHDIGDALLKEFAERLSACIRTTDTAARLGGDEFAAILETLGGREDGCHIAEKIVAAMRPEFAPGERRLNITTSVGVAFYEGDEETGAGALLKKADEALYQAKAAGRNNYQVAA